MIIFDAEIREVKIKKLITLDKEIKIVLTTADLNALKLAEVESDKTIQVKIEII